MKITLVAWGSVEQLPSIHSSLGLGLSTGVHPCNPYTQEEEAGGSQVQRHHLLQNRFSSSLGYLKFYLKKRRRRQRRRRRRERRTHKECSWRRRRQRRRRKRERRTSKECSWRKRPTRMTRNHLKQTGEVLPLRMKWKDPSDKDQETESKQNWARAGASVDQNLLVGSIAECVLAQTFKNETLLFRMCSHRNSWDSRINACIETILFHCHKMIKVWYMSLMHNEHWIDTKQTSQAYWKNIEKMPKEIRQDSTWCDGEMLSASQPSPIHALGDRLTSATGFPGARCWDTVNGKKVTAPDLMVSTL